MKFGIFLPNGSNGFIISEASPVYKPTYTHNLAIAQEAERVGFDLLISMIKYRGFGGSTGYWDACIDSFTLTAALAVATSKIKIFASAGLPSLHPAVAAKMIASLDDISGGRVGLNIVTGWNRPEYQQMGLWPADDYHATRYEYAEEYIKIVKSLWYNDSTTHQSKLFSLNDCKSYPKPSEPIEVVCAGQSPRGIRFTAEHGDYNFVLAPQNRLRAMTATMKDEAAKHGRKVGTLARFTLVAAPSDEEAFDRTQSIIDHADTEAIRNMIASANMDTNKGGTADNFVEALKQDAAKGNMAYMSIPVISGSYASVARQIDELADDSGITGLLWVFPDYVQGIRDFGNHIMPLLKCETLAPESRLVSAG